jgi:multimeric flavodoxin WrbA
LKIVGIVGSPRHGRNTATLVQQVLDGAKSQGADVSLLYINDYDIAPCDACDGCKQTAECVLDDGMRTFYAAIDGIQGLVLGTPIYFDHVSAQTKLFLDRLYAYLGPDMERHFPERVRSVLVATWGDSDPDLYNDVIDWLQGRLSLYYGVETVAAIKAADADTIPPGRRPELLQAAFAAGVRLAERR